jgi:hypothetical protein
MDGIEAAGRIGKPVSVVVLHQTLQGVLQQP